MATGVGIRSGKVKVSLDPQVAIQDSFQGLGGILLLFFPVYGE